jgi:hypothetical protein
MTKEQRRERMRLLVYNFLRRLEQYQQAGAKVKYGEDDFRAHFGKRQYADEEVEQDEYGIAVSDSFIVMFWPEEWGGYTYKEQRQGLLDTGIVVYIPVNKKEKLYKLLETIDIIKEVEKEMK